MALQRADEKDPASAKVLRSLIGNTEDPAEIAQMAQIIADSGAPQMLEEQISALTESGLGHLRKAHVDPAVTETLEALAIKSTARRM